MSPSAPISRVGNPDHHLDSLMGQAINIAKAGAMHEEIEEGFQKRWGVSLDMDSDGFLYGSPPTKKSNYYVFPPKDKCEDKRKFVS